MSERSRISNRRQLIALFETSCVFNSALLNPDFPDIKIFPTKKTGVIRFYCQTHFLRSLYSRFNINGSILFRSKIAL